MAGLKAAFDEKTLFPRYILDFEAKMKVFHQQTLRDTTVCQMFKIIRKIPVSKIS